MKTRWIDLLLILLLLVLGARLSLKLLYPSTPERHRVPPVEAPSSQVTGFSVIT